MEDACMKGKIDTMDLLRMLLRFEVGRVAVVGDLKGFYTSFDLATDQWNLQRVLYRLNLDPEGETLEVIIRTLIFGVRSVSAQTEAAVVKLANHVRGNNPRLADFLLNGRYVDDLADSHANLDTLKDMVAEADELFTSVGLQCKGWTFSNSDPHPEVTKDGLSVDVGGFLWLPKSDEIEVKIPAIHFGKKSRGRLVVGTQVFEGSFEELNNFVPQELTKRQVVSKYAALYDVYGKLTPITSGMKVDVRLAVMSTSSWDDPVGPELRMKWVRNL